MAYQIDKYVYLGLSILVLIIIYLKILTNKRKNVQLSEPPRYEDVLNELNNRYSVIEEFQFMFELYSKKISIMIIFFNLNFYFVNYYFNKKAENLEKFVYYYVSFGDKVSNIALYKKADLNRVISVVLFVFIIYFMFLSVLPGNETIFFVSAANDNATYLCSEGACGVSADCDISAYGNSGDCTDCTYWAVGGSGDSDGYPVGGATLCCGDDASEYTIWYNQSSSDGCDDEDVEGCVGVNDNPSDDACCDTSTDCVYSGTCYAVGDSIDIDGDGVVGEYCMSGTINNWADCDISSVNCNAAKCSSRPFIVGGESSEFGEYENGDGEAGGECCGDDFGEYNYTYYADNALMENNVAINDSDVACCDSANSCVSNFQCTNSGSSGGDADGDGDTDYCDAGQWKDCNTDDDCEGEKICSQGVNDCVNPDGYIIIRNLGTTGIEETNQEFTSTRSVMLELNFSKDATDCRYVNALTINVLPNNGDSAWSVWENCVENRIWQLTNGTGLKQVFFQINFTDRESTFNDTITYNYTGSGLDTSPPNPATIVDGDYTNNNQTISITWYNASDPESTILGIPLIYQYVLYLENGTIIDSLLTGDRNKTTTGLNLKNGTIIYANVTVINSAGLTSKTTSDGLTIDLEKPGMWPVAGSFKNKTIYETLPGENDWFTSSEVNFSWQGYDVMSGSVVAYSYILTQNPNIEPDNVPEGTIGNFANHKSKRYYNLESGKYYFKVKPKDKAGNWGDSDTKAFSVDNSAPTKPEILTETRIGGNITYTWSQSTDGESSVVNYRINLTDSDGLVLDSVLTNDTVNLEWTFSNIATGLYNASVGALNGVGLWRWSNEDETQTDFTPPIIYVTPNGTGNPPNVRVITTSPIIKAWTNEQAVCYYNNTKFTYTNTTYHETKILSLQAGTYGYDIECIDNAGNSRVEPIEFWIALLSPDTINNAPNPLTTYENTLTTFTINVQNTFNLASIYNDRFSLTLDGEEIESSVFDRGDGNYNVSFEAPEPGLNYELKLWIDNGLNVTIDLDVYGLYLVASYVESGISPENKDHITYHNPTGSRRYGLASNTQSPDTSESTNDILNMSNIKLDKELFIFNTKPSAGITKKETLLNEGRFLELINPSFGYTTDNNFVINFILKYDTFVIQSEVGDTLTRGQYNLHLVRTSDGTNKIVKFTKKTGDRVVLVG